MEKLDLLLGLGGTDMMGTVVGAVERLISITNKRECGCKIA